jgi:hypothetical protein
MVDASTRSGATSPLVVVVGRQDVFVRVRRLRAGFDDGRNVGEAQANQDREEEFC